MKLNNKGFTLIELLAVIIILLAITVIAISSISAAIERNKVKQDNAKKNVIESYAEIYYNDHKNRLGTTGCIPVGSLTLSENELTDSNGGTFNGGVKYTDGKNFKYCDSSTCDDCTN